MVQFQLDHSGRHRVKALLQDKWCEVKEISAILKNNHLITTDEFKALSRYSICGQLWTVIHRPTNIFPHKITDCALEYIFDPEAFTMFCFISSNILANWETQSTMHLGPHDEFCLKDSIFIRPYNKHHWPNTKYLLQLKNEGSDTNYRLNGNVCR